MVGAVCCFDRVKLQERPGGRYEMPCVLSHQSTDHLPRGAAHAWMGQGAVLLLAHLAANFFTHTPGRSSRFLCQKTECDGCGNSRYRQHHCCPDGSKLFSETVQCVPSALADSHFVCVNHCRSSFGNAEEVENKDSVGGNDCTADGRSHYLGGA